MSNSMRASLQGFFIAGALLATAASLQAQGVTVRCGGGTVQTGGFTINQAGEVVFSEQSLACNVQQTGTCLPDPLQLSIGAPAAGTTIDVGTSAQTVQFSAQITNYSPTFDTCTLNVQPAPNTSWQAVTLQPNGSGAASTNVQFAQGAAAGTYSFQLSCTRTANQQQIVVPSVSRSINVNSSTPPPIGCADFPIPSIFAPVYQNNFTAVYTGGGAASGFGIEPNESSSWRDWTFINQFENSTLTAAGLRTWKFRPTPNTRVHLRAGNYGSGSQIAVSISECPGRFTGLPAGCSLGSGEIVWSTFSNAPSTQCKLDPNKDYYISAASIDLSALLTNSTYTANGCVGSCSTANGWQARNAPF